MRSYWSGSERYAALRRVKQAYPECSRLVDDAYSTISTMHMKPQMRLIKPQAQFLRAMECIIAQSYLEG
jgi:hypothetical protein